MYLLYSLKIKFIIYKNIKEDKMEAKEKEILNELLASTKVQYIVPVFQRNYDWKDKECKVLFEDIITLAKDKKNPTRKHFMGAFVYKFNKIIETSFNEHTLIDGQQRLTSISLILKALYDHLDTKSDSNKELKNEIYETYLVNKFAKNSNYKLKLKPNDLDNESYENLMNNPTNLDNGSNIFRNYINFKNWITEMDVSIIDFYQALQRLEGVAVSLDDDDDPQLIFESLNSTGLELSDVDLIRNFLLMNTKPEFQKDLYINYWLKLEELLKDNFLNFIRDFLSMKNGFVTASSRSKVYETFRHYYNNNFNRNENESLKMFLGDFLIKAKIYNKLLIKSTHKSSLSLALNDYIELEMKTTYPFLLALLIKNDQETSKKEVTDESLTNVLRILEAYIIRRNVCNLAGGGLSQLMANLYNALYSEYEDKLFVKLEEFVSKALLSISTKAYFPTDKEFYREFTERDMYGNRNIEFILRKIEKSFQSKELITTENLSIEHVFPQNPSEKLLQDQKINPLEFKEKYGSIVNQIGNLTLTAYNSEMSNKPFNDKKAHIEFSRLSLNIYFKDINKWTLEEIEKRSEFLGKIALKVWPTPEVRNTHDIFKENHYLLDENDDFEYSGTSPKAISINGETILVSSWMNIYEIVLNEIYKLNKNLFISLFTKTGYVNSEKPLISDNPRYLRNQENL